jgi:anti-sigma regulatory factor (Ser/Thr protein kinase)
VLDLVGLVRRSCDLLAPAAEEAKVTIDIAAAVDEAPCPVDAEAVERIVLNLVANAVKYSFEGGLIEVAVRDAEGLWRVEVADAGPGVPDNLKERVFEPFVRQETLKPNVPSTGLGLAIVHSLVHQHDGQVGVEDRPGGGSLFWFELPALAEPSRHPQCHVVEAVGLAEDLAVDLRTLLERQAMQLHLYADPHALLANSEAAAGWVVIDLASTETSECLYSLLKELEHHGLPRTCVLPPPEKPVPADQVPEASRLFSFVEVLRQRPSASELARALAPES